MNLLPLLALTFALQTPSATQEPFGEEIRKFESQDAVAPPAKGGIVFVGSSSIRMWSSLKEDFPGLNVINRGFGGSELEHSVRYVHRIVTPYAPRLVVLFAGTNDLAGGKSPEQVLGDYRDFVREVRSRLPESRIVYISITPAPSRWNKLWQVMKTNRLIQEETRRGQNLGFVDVFQRFLSPNGGPRPELFLTDQLHMNRKGYEIWVDALRPILTSFR